VKWLSGVGREFSGAEELYLMGHLDNDTNGADGEVSRDHQERIVEGREAKAKGSASKGSRKGREKGKTNGYPVLFGRREL
jgi:hypothetical protein